MPTTTENLELTLLSGTDNFDTDTIMENFTKIDTAVGEADSSIGEKDSLTTTAKDNLVAAINEVDGNIGDLSGLTTTAKTNLVSALNEVNQKILKRKVISVSVDSDINVQQVNIPEANIIYSVMFFYTEGLYYLIGTDGYSLAISLSADNQITLIKFGGNFTVKRELKMVVLYM